jgi:hypothetical protein
MRSFWILRGVMAVRLALWTSCATLLLAGLPHAAAAGDPGSAGFLSLRLGTGARAAGMGDAFVSLADDATAVYWNPAGIASVSTTSLALQHNEWLDTVRVESAAVAHATEVGVFGLHFSGMYMDEIERTEGPSGQPAGTFNVYEIATTGAYAHKIRDWDVGGAIKWLHSGLDDVSADGWAVDVGARYHTKISGLTFGAAAQHLGPDMKFVSDAFKLPATLRAGADYLWNFANYKSDVVVAYDLEVVNDDNEARNHFGVEYSYMDLLSVRAGYKTGFDSQNAAFGVGVHKSGYRFDYAFNNIDGDLGHAHRFSLGIDLN